MSSKHRTEKITQIFYEEKNLYYNIVHTCKGEAKQQENREEIFSAEFYLIFAFLQSTIFSEV
jgi:hypothetical protein